MNGSHQLRRKQFYQNLNAGEAVVLFAGAAPRKTADASYPFFTNRNFYYLTGILQIDSIFFAINQGGRVEETLFIHDKNPMAERWHGYRISHQEAIEASGIMASCPYIEAVPSFASFLVSFAILVVS